MQIDAISLYAKYTETYKRLRPQNTFCPVLWDALPPWLQAVWVEMAIWIDAELEHGCQKVVFAADCKDDNCPQCGVYYSDCPRPGPTMEDEYEYKEADGVLYARRKQ